ncbi:MAG: bifunctional heptose 7-phosphate kinase/heptose 1-phosphate adenyltransferase [Caldicoprobacterales bacterium]|jgi:rfaE bifunctional protein kinase chain/domain|nr:sugar kinase [Clostridiales bacterium]
MEQRQIVELGIKDIRLPEMFDKILNVRIGIVGDGCLDIYWDADMRLSELSRETPHHPLPVIEERFYLGAGGNVAANVKSLKAEKVYMLSLIGNDWRGEGFLKSMKDWGIDDRFMLTDENWVTPAYCKPLRRGYSEIWYEDPRIDFENRKALSEKQELSVIENLKALADAVDVIIVCDQFRYGVITESVRQELERLSKSGKTIMADSRSRIGLYRNMIIKPNEMEAVMALNDGGAVKETDMDVIIRCAVKIYEMNQAPVVITMGRKGALWYEGNDIYMVMGIPVEPPIDIVGAGDTFLAALACSYAAGFPGPLCIVFANLASSVVIRKIGITGTASPEEILEQASKIL